MGVLGENVIVFLSHSNYFFVVQLGLKLDQGDFLFLFSFGFKRSQPWRELSFWDAD